MNYRSPSAAPRRAGILERIFFVDYAHMQRVEGFGNSLRAYQVAMMLMFSRVGLPLLALICVAWMWFENGFPERYWLENLSGNQRLVGGGAYVMIVYVSLNLRFSRYISVPDFAHNHDTENNRRLAKYSFVLMVGFPILAWLAVTTLR